MLFAIILMLGALSMPLDAPLSAIKSEKVPPVSEVQKHAIQHARLDPSEISTWKKRARYSALLPRLQLDYSRKILNEVNVNINDNVYVGSSGSAVGPEEGSYAENLNADQNFGVKAIWDFSEAIFNTDSLAVSEEARLLARERHAVLAEVNKNYYEREKAMGEIAFLELQIKRGEDVYKAKRDIFACRMAFDEATAALDALTGGWFSEQTKK